MIFLVIILPLLFFPTPNSSSVIYQLNDTQYNRMPALYALDDYKTCTSEDDVYCLVRLDLYADSPNDVMDLIKGYSSYYQKHYNYTEIERGVCVSKSCHKEITDRNIQRYEDTNEVLEECLNRSIWMEYKIKAKLSQVYYCERENERLQMDRDDWTFIVFIITIALLNIFGSLYDVYLSRIQKTEKQIQGNKCLMSFSIFQNAKFLFSTQNANQRISHLKGIDGIKCLLQMAVVYIHTYQLIGAGFTENPHAFEQLYEYSLFKMSANGLILVQAFLVISGFIMVYQLRLNLKAAHISWKSLFKIIFLRWCRLTPASATVVLFAATLLRYVGSGPLWKYVITNGTSADCRKYWWFHMIYLNNFVSDDKFCIYQTWYTAAETQLLIIGLILYKMIRSQNFIKVSLIMMVFGTLATAFQIWIDDLDGVVVVTPEFIRRKCDLTFDKLHILPHCNLSSFAIGMISAHLVYSYQKKCTNFPKNKLLKTLSWLWFPSMLLVFLSGQTFYTDPVRASLALRMLYGSICRVAMGCIAAFVIFALVFRFNEKMCTIFEWNGWVVLNRLCYCVFLVHATFIHVLIGVRTQLAHVSFLNLIMLYISVLISSTIVALVLHLLVEVPVYRFIKSLVGVEEQKEKKIT